MGYKLGMKLGNADVERDMTHVAVMPVVSHQELRPGDRVTICGAEQAARISAEIRDVDCPDCLRDVKEQYPFKFGPEASAVHRPSHYGGKGPLEVIRVTEHYGLNHNMATIVTCLLRAGKKDTYPQDLSKALWYLVREIAIAKGENPNDWVELIPEGLR